MELDLSDVSHRIIHLTVPAGGKVLMSATRAKPGFDEARGYEIDFAKWPPRERRPDDGSVWATDIMQRCVVRFQRLGSTEMDYVFGDATRLSEANYGFMLRDTEPPPTAFPADFEESELPPDWCEGGFELFIAFHCGDQSRWGIWRNIKTMGPGDWIFEVSDENAGYRNEHKAYDYKVFLNVGPPDMLG